MKKIIAMMLVLAMALSLAACAGTGSNETTAPETTAPIETTAPTPVSALDAMDAIWTAWEFEYKDYFMGGGYTGSVSGMPGAIETTDTESLQYLLYVPEAELANVQSAASVMHAMNANTFTAAAFVVTDASAFAAAMKDALMNNQWMCGIPENLLVYTQGNCVLIAFGAADNVTGYSAALTTAFPDAVSVYDGAMA